MISNILQFLIGHGVPVFNQMPNGWKFIPNATAAPYGYRWIFNGKRYNSNEYKHALLKIK